MVYNRRYSTIEGDTVMNESKLEKFVGGTMFATAVVYVGGRYIVLPLARKFKQKVDES
jgi:hypothetical protein